MNTLLVCHFGEAKVQRQGAELVTKPLALNANVKLKTTELKPNQKTNLAKKTFAELSYHEYPTSRLTHRSQSTKETALENFEK
ncbi:hypothetical protein [Vibrio gallaecicus]|uniref:Uncharacterized protein n=1 Tax=Vibrio gallaecicus TaxID=552386 RepID=A0ABV4NGI1_9VIBR